MSKSQNKIRVINLRTDMERSELEAATGTQDWDLMHLILNQISRNVSMPDHLNDEECRHLIHSSLAALRGIAPQDEIEGMLACQMVSVHNAAMECLARAMNQEGSIKERDHNLRYAHKFLSLYGKQLETLNRNRGKGQQKVTVEHVQVQDGGKAIVGNVVHKGK